MSRTTWCLPVAILLTAPVFAHAAVSTEKASGGKAAEPDHSLSVTFSPIHLIISTFELTAEYEVVEDVGVAGLVGIGNFLGASIFEAGLQGRYYLLGSFEHGMQIGAELLYINVSLEDLEEDIQLSGVGTGYAIGPFVGYKVVSDAGFTFDAQLGYQYAAIEAKASASSGSTSASDSASDTGSIVLLNLNIGWSF